MNWHRIRVVCTTDLRQLWQSKDFWVPMLLLGSIFFLFVPLLLLSTINSVGEGATAQRLAQQLDVLPAATQAQIDENLPAGSPPQSRVIYALAVFLLAPIAVVVPLTISAAVGAATIVGERERGTGEFLAHSPASTREIYLGKLIASFIPGYLTTIGGFAIYSVLVNAFLAPRAGRLVFPTGPWWLLILWVLPAFLLLALSLILRISARVRSTAAAQQAAGLVSFPLIILGYTQSTGALFGTNVVQITFVLGGVAWVVAALSLASGMRSVRRSDLLGVANNR
ncbi:MAG: ABC transporter permease subunit [Acidimicrobiia bacterium]|nr:ABC transporter permease subunit [Acidimicrobiia bacterium]